MALGPRGSELTATVTSTVTTQTISVTLVTFDILSDPSGYLLSQLDDRIRVEVNAPSTSTLTCILISVSVLSDGRRKYSWTVTASWTV